MAQTRASEEDASSTFAFTAIGPNPATDEATLSGLYVETDDRTGLATKVQMVREGGRLMQSTPLDGL